MKVTNIHAVDVIKTIPTQAKSMIWLSIKSFPTEILDLHFRYTFVFYYDKSQAVKAYLGQHRTVDMRLACEKLWALGGTEPEEEPLIVGGTTHCIPKSAVSNVAATSSGIYCSQDSLKH